MTEFKVKMEIRNQWLSGKKAPWSYIIKTQTASTSSPTGMSWKTKMGVERKPGCAIMSYKGHNESSWGHQLSNLDAHWNPLELCKSRDSQKPLGIGLGICTF